MIPENTVPMRARRLRALERLSAALVLARASKPGSWAFRCRPYSTVDIKRMEAEEAVLTYRSGIVSDIREESHESE